MARRSACCILLFSALVIVSAKLPLASDVTGQYPGASATAESIKTSFNPSHDDWTTNYPKISKDPAPRSFCDDDPNNGFLLKWRDEFDGDVLDESVWRVAVDLTEWRWAYGRDALCMYDNVRIKDGNLVLRTQRQKVNKYNYTTAGVDTRLGLKLTPHETYRVSIPLSSDLQ